MGEKFRIKYNDDAKTILAISLGLARPTTKVGDCFIRVVCEDVGKAFIESGDFKPGEYAEAMTVVEIEEYLTTKGQEIVGKNVKRCIGMVLEDREGYFFTFPTPLVY